MVVKKPEPKKPVGRVNSYDARMAAMAAKSAALEDSRVTGGNFISTKNDRLSFKGHELPGNKMQLIIIGDICANTYYEGRYDPANPQPPVCYAFGENDKDMAPHENAPSPQNHSCHGCPLNEYKSAENGKGKACKNTRRLACLPLDVLDDPATIAQAEVVYLSVPPTSLKHFAGYNKAVTETLQKPLAVIVTEVQLENKELSFRNIREIKDPKQVGPLLDKSDAEVEAIAFPFPAAAEPEPAKKAAAGRGGAKTPPAKSGGAKGAAPKRKYA